LAEAIRDRGAALPVLAQRQLSREERLERRLLVLAVALPEHRARYLAQVPPESLSTEEHRRAVALLAAGEGPEAWPAELAGLGLALRAEAAMTDAGEDELHEAVFRVQLPALERRAERLRQDGDEAGRLRVLELIREARSAAARGER
jgi:hypothetical protein